MLEVWMLNVRQNPEGVILLNHMPDLPETKPRRGDIIITLLQHGVHPNPEGVTLL